MSTQFACSVQALCASHPYRFYLHSTDCACIYQPMQHVLCCTYEHLRCHSAKQHYDPAAAGTMSMRSLLAQCNTVFFASRLERRWAQAPTPPGALAQHDIDHHPQLRQVSTTANPQICHPSVCRTLLGFLTMYPSHVCVTLRLRTVTMMLNAAIHCPMGKGTHFGQGTQVHILLALCRLQVVVHAMK